MKLLRAVAVLALGVSLAMPGFATPKRLDLKKLLAQPQPKRQEFLPARAGWDGPEQVVKPNAYMQHMEAATPNIAAEWEAVLVPDWRILLLLTAAILGLRQLRKTTPRQQPASYQQPPADTLRAA